jgi:geranylgeranyl pyrophosphate synthase
VESARRSHRLRVQLLPSGSPQETRPNCFGRVSACEGNGDDAVPVAAAFEFFDRFMLLHDELVEDDAQTGQALARWGLGQSLNAGDALYALALRALAEDVIDAGRRLEVAAFVARAILDAIEGRNVDVGRFSRGERDGFFARIRSLRRRSAALSGAALQAGAAIAGASEEVRRGFDRAGRLLDAAAIAAASNESSIAERLVEKAVASVERCLEDSAQAENFAEVARYVAARVA